MNATGPVTIADQGSGLFTTTVGNGAGGNINLRGSAIQLSNGASISATSSGRGNAGNITVNAGNQFTMMNSSVTTEANQSSGGAIKITTNPNGTVQLTDSTISASVLDGTGGGGSVNIDPQFVILQNSQILANAVQGPGGNISITTNFLLPDANSVISASSQFGVNGTVTIQSPNAPVSGQIQPLGKTPLLADVAAQPTLRSPGRRRVQQLHRGGTGQPANRTGQLARQSAARRCMQVWD